MLLGYKHALRVFNHWYSVERSCRLCNTGRSHDMRVNLDQMGLGKMDGRLELYIRIDYSRICHVISLVLLYGSLVL
jgi:hypothetical protein